MKNRTVYVVTHDPDGASSPDIEVFEKPKRAVKRWLALTGKDKGRTSAVRRLLLEGHVFDEFNHHDETTYGLTFATVK